MKTEWLPAHSIPSLAGDIHVWRASLVRESNVLSQYWQLLSRDERERAERFVFEKDCNRFVIARATLRLLLSRYIEREPDRIVFRYSSRGKPALLENPACLEFNVSHSYAWGLYAFTLHSQIGVDIEYLAREIGGHEIAERFFSPWEIAALRTLPAEGYKQGFFNCWTRKEAYLKANGEGIAVGLDQFSVSLAPDEPARLVETRLLPGGPAEWSLYHVEPAQDYVGAVAVRGRIHHVSCWSDPA